jgi:centromere protein X
MDSDDEEPAKSIPPVLITRLLHEFFEKDGTRITKDANEATAKYIDVFVREAIARAAVEKESGFLEVCFLRIMSTSRADEKQVEDLEKIAPQLLLDL